MKSQIVHCMQTWPSLSALLLVAIVQPCAACANSTPGALPNNRAGTVVGAPKQPSAPSLPAPEDPLPTQPEPAGMTALEQPTGAGAAGQAAGVGGARADGVAGSAAGRHAEDDEEDDD